MMFKSLSVVNNSIDGWSYLQKSHTLFIQFDSITQRLVWSGSTNNNDRVFAYDLNESIARPNSFR